MAINISFTETNDGGVGKEYLQIPNVIVSNSMYNVYNV